MVNERQTKDIAELVRFDGLFLFYSRLNCFQILHDLKQAQKVNTGNFNLEHYGKVYGLLVASRKTSPNEINFTDLYNS